MKLKTLHISFSQAVSFGKTAPVSTGASLKKLKE
jgi:hypothetical protein